MSKFKVGDAVRVKAGSPSVLWRLGSKEIPKEQMHIVEGYFSDKYGERVHLVGGDYVAEAQYLEPWNDSEEWDGEKWVAKYNPVQFLYNGVPVSIEVEDWKPPQPKPAIVILREDGILKPNTNPTVHESTSKAKAEAKRLAEKHKGQEFVVFQEVDSKRVEKPVYPEFQHGDVVKAVRKAECDVFPDNNPVTLKDTCVVVNGYSASDNEYFNAWIGDDLPCYRKSDFIKIGHVDL